MGLSVTRESGDQTGVMAMMIPQVDADAVAWISTEQMVEVDRIMIEDLHIELIQMMENAGRNLARLTTALCEPTTAVVCIGRGGNGGGGLVAARHLANMGVEVTVLSAKPLDGFWGVPQHQLDIVQRMGLAVSDSMTLATVGSTDVIVDAVIGYSLHGAPHGRTAELIAEINANSAPVVALDAPSGLDTATGETPGAAVVADATLTLAMPKLGLRTSPNVGRLFVGDISVPGSVWTSMGVETAPLFGAVSVVEIV